MGLSVIGIGTVTVSNNIVTMRVWTIGVCSNILYSEKQRIEGALYDNGRKNKTTTKCKRVYTGNACRKNECVSFCDCKMGKTVDDLLNEIENENLYKALLTIDRCTLQIVLLKMKGYSTKEIAPIVGLTTGAVYSRLEYLRKKLKKVL